MESNFRLQNGQSLETTGAQGLPFICNGWPETGSGQSLFACFVVEKNTNFLYMGAHGAQRLLAITRKRSFLVIANSQDCASKESPGDRTVSRRSGRSQPRYEFAFRSSILFLRQDLADQFAVHIRQPEVAPAVGIRQPRMVDAQ